MIPDHVGAKAVKPKYGVARFNDRSYVFSVIHDNIEDARTEAERLCRKEKASFYIVEMKEKCFMEEIPVKWVTI